MKEINLRVFSGPQPPNFYIVRALISKGLLMEKGAKLECINVNRVFGDFYALRNVNVTFNPNELIGIVGPNGAGKTTLFNVITNVGYRLTSGRIELDGKRIDRQRPDQIRRVGIARTFQIPAYFPSFTCLESVRLAVWNSKENLSSVDDEARSVLERVGLKKEMNRNTKEITLFDLKRLMIATAIASNVRLLLLDEPFGGLCPEEIYSLMELIRKIHEENCTIAIIEHKIRFLIDLVERLVVLHSGEKIAEGEPKGIMNDPLVKSVYLGEFF